MENNKEYIYNLTKEQKNFIKNKSIEEFKKVMSSREINLKEKQIEFAKDITENILTNHKNKIYVNCNRAGMGKSTIITILLHYLVLDYLNLKIDDDLKELFQNKKPYEINEDGRKKNYRYTGFGAIYITDNLKRLDSFYNNPLIFDLCGLINSDILQDEQNKDNTKWNNLMFKYYNKPIIAMTTQKFKLLTNEEKRSLFKFSSGDRKLLIFDEKPLDLIMESIIINQAYISECITKIDNEIEEDELNRKDFLKRYMYELEEKVNNENNNKHNLTYVAKRKYPVLIDEIKDKDFFKILKEKASNELYEKISKIKLMFEKGYIFEKSTNSNAEDNKANKIMVLKNNMNNSFSTDTYNIILDATGYNDTDYLINDRFIINNPKDFKENYDINFRFFDIPSSKTSLFNKEYRSKFLEYIEKLIDKDNMLITFNKWFDDYINKFEIDKNNIEHFGNIKGKNNWCNLSNYMQIGFLRKSDSYYLAKYLLIYDKIDELNSMKQEEIDYYISQLVEKDNYFKFRNKELEEIFLSDLIVDTNQNLMRIKCRNYNNIDICTVNLIYAKNAYEGFEHKLLDSLGMNFERAKEENLIHYYPRPEGLINHKEAKERKNLVKGYNEFIMWYSTWNGEKILVSDVKKICNINTKQWEKLKQHKDIKIYFNNIKIIKESKSWVMIKAN